MTIGLPIHSDTTEQHVAPHKLCLKQNAWLLVKLEIDHNHRQNATNPLSFGGTMLMSVLRRSPDK